MISSKNPTEPNQVEKQKERFEIKFIDNILIKGNCIGKSFAHVL